MKRPLTCAALGAGPGAWNSPARPSLSSPGSTTGVGLPLVKETTNDVGDQFERKLSAYAKGKPGKCDCRLAVAAPRRYQKAEGCTATSVTNAAFLGYPPKAWYREHMQW